MTKQRILFVDDEPSVLGALESILRKERHRWDVVVALGGVEALLELERAPVDVIVSDMRMPGMDGAELLSRVKALYPRTARLVLSGHADQAALLRTLCVAHQFLSKPREAIVLRAAIQRTIDLQQKLNDEGNRTLVGSLGGLPSASRLYADLERAAADPKSDATEIARIIRRDPAMTIKILQLVNSAFFRQSSGVVSVERAVAFLGLELIRGLALTAQIFSGIDQRSLKGLSLDAFQVESVRAARLAKRFASPEHADEAFTAALVHDIGKVVLALGAPDKFADAVRQAKESGRPLHVVEREVLGSNHAEVGAYLLGAWGLPFSIVESVAYHDEPRGVAEGPCEVVAVVHAVDALMAELDASDPSEAILDTDFMERAGLSGKLETWRAMVKEEVTDGRSSVT
jgi:HD-like signal output (HDOD) protein/CheY-like chemotaxis protein